MCSSTDSGWITAILGLTAVIHPLSVDEHMIAVDMWVLGGTAALLIAWLLFARRIGRLAGALSLAAYGGYIALLTLG